MRVVSADGREVIATSEELTSVSALPDETLIHAQHLNLSFNALKSLQGLCIATQLRNLNVSHNAITSLHGVEVFSHLRLLRCSGNCISDLSWLAALPSLRELWINDNHIETPQIAHVATVRALDTLVLHPNPCTNAVNYVSYVVKTVPWLARVDLVVVDDALRQQCQHVDERVLLSSAATDVSEISLMTSRSDGSASEVPGPENHKSTKEQTYMTSKPTNELAKASSTGNTSTKVLIKESTKKTKKMTAEDFMRSFPVQDFIPAATEDTKSQNVSLSSLSLNQSAAQLDGVDEAPVKGNVIGSNQDCDEIEQPESILPPHDQAEPNAQSNLSLSAIASAVQSLPRFQDASSLQKNKRPAAGLTTKSKKPTNKDSLSKAVPAPTTDPALASFNQQEWVVTYPNSTVNAVQIRADGSALAKWPGGSVAVSVDRERDGFRCYAAHKDGTIALSFDAEGVGFINYYPSGRMMISTSSGGDGLYFSTEGTIVRQWDAQLNVKNDKWEATNFLGDSEPDGALVSRLSDDLGIRLQLIPAGKHTDGSHRSSTIALTVFFNSGTGIRHAFSNWINKSESTSTHCDVIFGKCLPKLKKKASNVRTYAHVDTLHDIRAAVAKLS